MRSCSEANAEGATAAGTLRRYFSRLLELQGRLAILAFVCMLFSALLNGLGLFTLVPILQLAGVAEGRPVGFVGWVQGVCLQSGIKISLGYVLSVFLTIFAAHSVASWKMNLISADLQQSFTKALEQRLYASIMRADWSFFLAHRNSDLTFALTRNVQRVAAGTICFLQLTSIMVIATFHSALCILISPMFSISMLACGAALACVAWRYNGRISHSGKQVVGLNQQLYGRVTEYLLGMREAKSACSEQQQIDSFALTSNSIRQNWLNFYRIRENTSLMYRLGAMVLLSLALYVALEIFDVPIIEMTLLVVIAGRLFPRIQAIHSNWQQVLQMLPAFDSIMDLLQQSEAAREVKVDECETKFALRKAIRFQDVGFHYTAETTVLSGLSFDIPVGTTVAIVGASGAGKSTLADLLMGLISAKSGHVLIDGQKLCPENLRAWRSQIGYVPQQTFLLNDTLRANLLWSNPDATEDALWLALRMSSAAEFVAGLPDGLDTILGDQGMRLSGGERQRISMARALVRQPKLLILDEATSSLDGENQLRIQQSIHELRGQITIVMIAHRLSAVRNVDQVVVIDKGRVQECGSYDSLAANEASRFRQMLHREAA